MRARVCMCVRACARICVFIEVGRRVVEERAVRGEAYQNIQTPNSIGSFASFAFA